jgi:hypothetical protein
LSLSSDILVSKFAFTFNLYRYNAVSFGVTLAVLTNLAQMVYWKSLTRKVGAAVQAEFS